ncbi:malectin domain-containing carbohydrate-binding protein, partial [Hymenobacter wooponensis]
DGILLRPGQTLIQGAQVFNMVYNTQLVGNTVENVEAAANTGAPAYIGLLPYQYGVSQTLGTAAIGVEIRDNILTARPSYVRSTMNNNVLGTEGYYNYFLAQFNGPIGNAAVTLGTIFQNNTARNTANAFYLSTGAHSTLLCSTTLSNVGNLVEDRTLPNSTQASQNTAACAAVAGETLRNPENPSGTVAGLEYKYYEGYWSQLPDFNTLTPVKTGQVANFDLSLRQRDSGYGLQFTGYITVPQDGQYTFFTNSDDGSKVFIGSTQVLFNDNSQGNSEKSGSIGLKAGTHAFTVTYFQSGGGQSLNVNFQGPGVPKQTIPASVLKRGGTTSVAPTAPSSPASASTYRINAGGPQLSTAAGTFSADGYYSANSSVHSTTAAINPLYQTERYGTNGTLSYTLPIPNGTYQVVLHFAELYWTSAGRRVFDVSLENTKVLDNYDIFRKVGALTGTTETFTVNVTDGSLNLYMSSLAGDGGIDQPKLSAIEVVPSSGATPPTATSTYRVNSGGAQVSTTIGTFTADNYYTGSTSTYSTTAAINGIDALYQTERYGTNGTLNYAFPVTNGSYRVVLHFAELYWTSAGRRVFDVSLENTKVLDNYDIFRKVGALTGTTETFTVNVTDGTLNLYMSSLASDGGVDAAKISAIEIVPNTSVSATGSSTMQVLPGASSLEGKAATASAITAYPNPTTGAFTVSCASEAVQTASLTLMDALGKVVLQQRVELSAGQNEVPVQAQQLPQGLYQLILTPAKGARQVGKVLIQH